MKFSDMGYDRPHSYAPEAQRIKLPPEDDAPLGWTWIMLLVVVLGCLLFFSCSAPETPKDLVQPVAYRLAADSRPTVFGLCAWSDQRSRELSARFNIPEPVTMFIPDRTPVRVVECWGIPVARLHTLGQYSNEGCLITIWMIDVDGVPFPADELMQTWRHEYVHHYDFCNGVPHPDGAHNDLFEFRIMEMGL